MALFKTLICLQGNDNGRRFLIISLCCYVLLILLSPVLTKAAILLVLLLITSSPLLAASSIRRIRDAGFPLYLAAIPVIIYWLNLFGISYIEHGAKWALLFIGFVATLAMATISNARVRHNNHYVNGYFGPIIVEKNHQSPVHHNRIEPTIAGQKQSTEELAHGETEPLRFDQETVNPDKISASKSYNDESFLQSDDFSNNRLSWEQHLGHWFSDNKKISLIVAISVSALILISIIFSNTEEIVKDPIEAVKPAESFSKQRLNKLIMPDQFWLMLDQNDAVTIGWEGDYKNDEQLQQNGVYWSAETAKGDKDCVNLHFSLGNDIKVLKVTVKSGGDYYADFSPVDSSVIIKSIADKDRFSLCGYEFTLKGTRSLLRKNTAYYQYLKVE